MMFSAAQPEFATLWRELFQEHFVYGHLPYLLFVLSMLMRDIKWLRIIAICAGVLRIYIRAYIVFDPVTVMWESTLVLVNVGQLALIWWDGRHRRLNDEERSFLAFALPGLSRREALRLLALGTWVDVATDDTLTLEGQPVPRLLYIAEGVARIEKQGRVVARCARGDFIGEMSFGTGGPATATAIAEQPMRVMGFDAPALRAALARDAALRRALETGFGRNLIAKLEKANTAAAEA